MIHLVPSATLAMLLASSAWSQSTSPPTCFDSLADPCNNGCVDPPAVGMKSIVIFTPPIECTASGSFAAAGAAAVYDPKQCGISHGTVEITSNYDACADTSMSCGSFACAHASAGNNLAGACASTDNSMIIVESFIERTGDNNCYVAEAAFATSSAWIQPARDSKPTTACIEFQTPAFPPELTFHARITSCGCEWVISSPNGSISSSGVTEEITPELMNDSWSICCYIPTNGDPFTMNTIDLPLSTWDVNADGRFNAADVQMIIAATQAALQNCTSNVISDCVNMAYDINADGDVNNEDFQLFWDLLDCGFDTGIFGDFDQDGDVDCDDYDAGRLFLGSGLGGQFTPIDITDPGYIFELDQDLDGLIDINEVNAFLALFPHCP